MSAPSRITRLPDRELVKLAQKISKSLDDSYLTIYFIGGSAVSGDDGKNVAQMPNDTYSVERVEIYTKEPLRRIDICRGRYSGSDNLDRNKFIHQRESSLFDEYALFATNSPFSKGDALSIAKIFSPYHAIAPSGGDVDLASLVSTQLEHLRQVAAEFTKRQVDAESRLEKAYRKREGALEERVASEELRLAALRREAEEKLSAERSKLEAWRNEINDREPQHERRRLRELLNTELRQYLDQPVTKSSSREWISSISYLVFGGVLLITSILLTFQASVNGSKDLIAFWTTSAKSLLAGVGGAAFVWAGLAGMKAAAKTSRAHEQQIQRYSFDMDRASWVVETLLQMSKSEISQVPDEWLSAVCRDLFHSPDEKQEDVRSVDVLSALLGVTARARIGTSGFDFELDRKDIKRLAAEKDSV